MSSSGSTNSLFFWCCTMLCTLFACYQTWLATAWGAGLSPDSISYLEGARSILKDGNLSGLGSHWPPLYFLLIALFSLMTHDPFVAIRWLQVITMGANILLITFIVYKNTEKSLIASLAAAVLFITSPIVLNIHAMAWTEAFFCLLTLLGFYFLSEYLRSTKNLFFFLSACFIGLAFVTRYAGVAVILTVVAVLFLAKKGKILHRIMSCIFFAFLSTIPMLIWMVRNYLLDNATTDRIFIFHPVPMQKIYYGLHVLLSWFQLQGNHSVLLLGICCAIFIAYIFSLYAFSEDKYRQNWLLEICFFFVLIYISFIVFSISFFDAHTPLDQRILYPAYVFFFIGLVLLYRRLSQISSFTKVSIILPLLLLFLSFKQLPAQQFFLSNAIENGLGFASKQWLENDILSKLKGIPLSTIIYTNGPDPITIYTGRKSTMLPMHTNPITHQKNKKFNTEIDQMQQVLQKKNGIIVYFININWRWYLPSLQYLSHKFPLQLIYQGRNGVIIKLSGTKQLSKKDYIYNDTNTL